MDTKEVERLFNAVRNFPGTAETAINEVFHNDAPPIVSEEIKRLMPSSDPADVWIGKLPHAKLSKSVAGRPAEMKNLAFTVGTTAKYHYLYFPDDGSNTIRHAGNQQFFQRGGENKQAEIADRCIMRITSDFEKSK